MKFGQLFSLRARGGGRSPPSAATDLYGAPVINPLPTLQRNGLIAVSTLGMISLLCTLSLLCFFTYRFIFWRKYYRRYIGYNQYVVLVYNLVLADSQMALGFIMSLRWVSTNSLHASDAACFLQGIWLQIGDPMSGMFVLAIAVHTFLHVSLGYQVPHRVLIATVVGLWALGVVLTVIPIGSYGRYVFYPAVAWCWMTLEHTDLRLWTHYFWIFAAQFFTVLLYAIMFFQLRRQIAESAILGNSNMASLKRLKRVVTYMVMYPIVYTVLSLPLAAGRMAAANGNPPSVLYFCIAGSMMAASGLCDTLMYTLTRKSIVLEPEWRIEDGAGTYLSKSKASHNKLYSMTGAEDATKATVTAITRKRSDSTDAIMYNPDVELAPMGQVHQQTRIEVTHEPASAYSGEGSSDTTLNKPMDGRHTPSKPHRKWK